MKSVQSARARLRAYPRLLQECSPQASAYAKCVSLDLDVRKGACSKEFEAFVSCIRGAAAKFGTRL